MKAPVALCVIVLYALGAWGAADSAIDDVLRYLRGMPVSQEIRATLVGPMEQALRGGRATPMVTLTYLEHASELPRAQMEQALEVLVAGHQAGLLMDPLMNNALKLWAMRRPWSDINEELGLRLRILLSAQDLMVARRARSTVALQTAICAVTQAMGVQEVGWAIGDHIATGMDIEDTDAMVVRARERLLRLRGMAPCVDTVDALLEALSPELVRDIVARAVDGR